MGGIEITDTAMRCETSGHTAAQQDDGTWRVTWLADVALDRNQAISALMVAQMLTASGGTLEGLTPKGCALVASLSSELGLTAEQAVERLAAARDEASP